MKGNYFAVPFSLLTHMRGLVQETGGGRRGRISQIRAQLATDLLESYGSKLTEAGRQPGVSTSAISKIYIRGR